MFSGLITIENVIGSDPRTKGLPCSIYDMGFKSYEQNYRVLFGAKLGTRVPDIYKPYLHLYKKESPLIQVFKKGEIYV